MQPGDEERRLIEGLQAMEAYPAHDRLCLLGQFKFKRWRVRG